MTSVLDLFPSKIIPEPNSGCWIWTGALSHNGYAVVRRDRGNERIHRTSYAMKSGGIPDGYHIDHLCRVRCCVNPDHLEAVTPAENQFRGAAARLGLKSEYREGYCCRGHSLTEPGARLPGRICRQCVNDRMRTPEQKAKNRARYKAKSPRGEMRKWETARQRALAIRLDQGVRA